MKRLLLFAFLAVMPLVSCSSSDDVTIENNENEVIIDFENKVSVDDASKIEIVIDDVEYVYDKIYAEGFDKIIATQRNNPQNILYLHNYKEGYFGIGDIYLKVIMEGVEYMPYEGDRGVKIRIISSPKGTIKGSLNGFVKSYDAEGKIPLLNISSGTIDIKYTYEEVKKEN